MKHAATHHIIQYRTDSGKWIDLLVGSRPKCATALPYYLKTFRGKYTLRFIRRETVILDEYHPA